MKDKELYNWYKRMIESQPEDPPKDCWEKIQYTLDKDLLKWYHHGIEDQDGEPPQSAWENIENKLDRGLFMWYGQKIENQQDEPPASVWNNIHDELDIADTWNRITQKLDKTLPKNAVMIYAAAAVLLIFLAIQMLMPFQGEQEMSVVGEVNEYVFEQNEANQIAQESQEYADGAPADESGFHPDNAVPESSIGKTGQNTDITPTNLPMPQMEKSSGEKFLLSGKEASLPAKMNPKIMKMGITFDSNPGNLASYDQVERASEKIKPASSISNQYYVGLTGEVGQSWLLSQKTSYSIRKSPYSSAIPNQGESFGILGGMKINERLAFQLEGLIKNENGQTYKEYKDGQVINNQIYLDYTSLNILSRYQLFQNSFKLPLTHHALLGFYGSYLKHASESYNGSSKNLRYAYKNYDLGSILGYELDAKISPKFILSAGFRFNPGLINIYEGMPNLPADFNKTYSSSININITLTCIIRNKYR
jgi:hypothetical protein